MSALGSRWSRYAGHRSGVAIRRSSPLPRSDRRTMDAVSPKLPSTGHHGTQYRRKQITRRVYGIRAYFQCVSDYKQCYNSLVLLPFNCGGIKVYISGHCMGGISPIYYYILLYLFTVYYSINECIMYLIYCTVIYNNCCLIPYAPQNLFII